MRKIKEREALLEREVDIDKGLTAAQVQERTLKGYANDVKIGTSKSYWKIFADNIFTFFNFLCLAVFIWLITASRSFSDLKNISFFVIFVVNTMIGIVQEIKAKRTMDKTSLLSSPSVSVLRDGREIAIKLNEILLDEITLLSAGRQICSDSVLKSGEIEVNESLLTGESLPIKKCVGDSLLSGSFVVSGNGVAQVVNVAEQNYIQQLALEAKKFKKPDSQLVKSLRLIMRLIGILILPVAILAFLNNFNNELVLINNTSSDMYGAFAYWGEYSKAELYEAYRNAVFPTSTSLIGMIPAGMFLLTSVALAVGVIRLYKRKAVVRELYSIETLARVDTLCLDKTGTITDGTMKVKQALVLDRKTTEEEVGRIIASMQFALEENNSTALALQKAYGMTEHYQANFVLPFASERKNSAVRFGETLYVIGAPEYVSEKLSEENMRLSESFVAQGMRCLLLAKYNYKIKDDKIPKNTTPIALIVIEDNIKADCIETVKYFKDNDVKVRVISGDNALAVSVIAAKVGIDNADKYISLKDMSDEEVLAIANDYTVFGRVSPTQKKLLVQAYKAQGHTVAMTGDGINDILALKEADCSIAMANGSDATRNVAQLVLMDSNFSSMPSIVAEGRRVVNNIERSSTLFLTKTLFSFIITLIMVFMKKTIPFDPIQLSFTSLFAIGIPSFVMALETNNARIKGNFIQNIFKKIVPGAVALTIAIISIVLLNDSNLMHITPEQMKTMSMIVIFSVFVMIIIRISRPFNITRSVMLAFVLLCAALCIFIMPLFANQDWNLFNIAKLNNLTIIAVIISLIAITKVIIDGCAYVLEKYSDALWKTCRNFGDKINLALSKKDEEETKNEIVVESVNGAEILEAQNIGLEQIIKDDSKQPDKAVKTPNKTTKANSKAKATIAETPQTEAIKPVKSTVAKPAASSVKTQTKKSTKAEPLATASGEDSTKPVTTKAKPVQNAAPEKDASAKTAKQQPQNASAVSEVKKAKPQEKKVVTTQKENGDNKK